MEVNIHGLDVNIHGLDVNIHDLDVNNHSLYVNILGLDVHIHGLDVNIHSLDVTINGLDVNIHSLDVNIHSLDVNIHGLDVNLHCYSWFGCKPSLLFMVWMSTMIRKMKLEVMCSTGSRGWVSGSGTMKITANQGHKTEVWKWRCFVICYPIQVLTCLPLLEHIWIVTCWLFL